MKGYENVNWSHLAQVRIQLEGIYEHGNEPSVTIKESEFIGVAGFDVLTAVIMKISIFWDITPCSPFKYTDISEENVACLFRAEE
jgi:hypothetical protein